MDIFAYEGEKLIEKARVLSVGGRSIAFDKEEIKKPKEYIKNINFQTLRTIAEKIIYIFGNTQRKLKIRPFSNI